MLTLAKNSLIGTVMGKPIVGSSIYRGLEDAPLPGEYNLLPALEDPIFGPYIIAVRRAAGLKPGYDWRKLSAKPGAASSYEVKLSVASYHIKRTGAPTEEGFVLSKQPIPGRNCIVLASGFSDLLDALKDAPEAALTVI